jgi:hypothetical protein
MNIDWRHWQQCVTPTDLGNESTDLRMDSPLRSSAGVMSCCWGDYTMQLALQPYVGDPACGYFAKWKDQCWELYSCKIQMANSLTHSMISAPFLWSLFSLPYSLICGIKLFSVIEYAWCGSKGYYLSSARSFELCQIVQRGP